MRSIAVEAETEDNKELAIFTTEVAYLMAALDPKNSTSSNQRNRGGQ